MEVGEQPVEHAEPTGWVQEDPGASGIDGGQRIEASGNVRIGNFAPHSAAEPPCHGFQDPGGGGSDGDDAASGGFGAVDGGGRLGGEGESFLVHAVVGEAVGLHREEGACPDMQGEMGGFDAAGLELLKDPWGEVEAGRGCGYGPGVPGVDRLVSLPVGLRGGTFGTLDVGGQGQLAVEGSEVEDVGFEAELAMSLVVLGEDSGRKWGGRGTKVEEGAWADPFSRAEEGPPGPGRGFLEEEDFNGAADAATPVHFSSPEPGGDDLGVVEDEEIPGVEMVEEGAELGEGPGAGRPVEDQQSGCIPFRSRMLRDQLRRQVKIKVGNQHGGGREAQGSGVG